ncbi:peptidase [Sphingomonas sp. Leaf357]|uniref:PepSY-associated TM helix domain-containing protein n=1 Tax=Sphingomonas sp. Leaf357 TaxID=1736350 RepID=UPI0006FE8317|nr:PepSY-associated TM helix domain-containing protein [Sphingomonas sp. Leaf357]KQS03004.1 peptidase [Sphingomonas sp. Leaf357]
MTTKSRPLATLVQRALGGHAAIGLLASALLYIIALTGTLIVIHDRWQRWEQPAIAETETLSPEGAQAAMGTVLASERGKTRTTHLYIRMPTGDLPRAVVTTDHGGQYVDGAGRIVGREAHAWTEFVIGLHEYLHLPSTLGLIVVGALGVALSALVVTGVLAHPRILRDAFRLRTRHDAQIARADWHNRLGVWTLPFVLAVALTGAFIGLGSVGFSVLAKAYTGGDAAKIYAPIFGHEPKPDPSGAPSPDIAAALRTLATRVPYAVPTYVIVHDPGTRGQHVQIIAEHPRRLIYGETYAFDARGQWRGATGLSDGALGQQAAASAYNLHFGNYGGLAIELAYMLLGLGLCVVTATGTTLWLQKRRRRGLGGDRLAACWEVVIWGTPLLLVASIWLRAIVGPDAPLVWSFWGLLVAGLAIAAVHPSWPARHRLQQAALLSVLATAVLHLAIFWLPAWPIVAIDLCALALASAGLVIRGRAAPVSDARVRRSPPPGGGSHPLAGPRT